MTEWSDFVFYHCRFPRCNEPCLNRIDSRYALTKSCRECYRDDLLEEQDPPVDHLPWAGDSRPAPRATASEGEGEAARPAAQPAGEQPEPERERPERSAPARPAGSAPSRGDPEARAHPPNPPGEGDLHSDTHQPDTDAETETEQGALE